MTFLSSALTGAQYAKLRGGGSTVPRWSGAQYISLVPNTNVYTARVNGAPSSSPFAEITYDNASGTLADVQIGMTVLISHTNDRRAAYFAGRIRIVPNGTTLYINETSANIEDNDYIFVIDDYRLWPKLGRWAAGAQVKDWATAFRQIPPVVVGLQTFYAGFVNTSNVLRLAFDISSSYAATSGASISSYSWTFPSGTSVVSGGLTSSAVTIDFPVGVPKWCSVTVTDSGSRTMTRRFVVHAAARAGAYAPASGFNGASLTHDLNSGSSGTVSAFDGVSDVLDNTLVCIWREEYYNDTLGSLTAATNDPRNVDFAGRLRTERNASKIDDRATLVNEVEFELEGVGAQLARLHGALITMTDSASPTVWDEITALTPWRAIVHVLTEHSTFTALHDLTFDSTAATFRCKGLTTQGGNLLGVVNDIGESINAAIEFSPAGAARVVRNAVYLTTAERNALTTIADFAELDYIDLGLNIGHVDSAGRLEASGGSYDSTSGNVTPFLALAPGHAQEYPEGTQGLSRQILAANVSAATAQNELNVRAGHALAAANGLAELSIAHPDGYHFLVPSRRYWFTWTLDSDNNIRGRSYSTSDRWLLTNVSVAHDNATGTRSVTATYIQETEGDAGETVSYPASGELPLDPGLFLPGFDPYPGFSFEPIDGGISDIIGEDPFGNSNVKTDGSTVLCWSATNVYLTLNFLASNNPTWRDITPESIVTNGYTVAAAAWYLGYDGRCYVLANDGTDSFVYTTDDAFASPPTWTVGATLSGLYTVLRTTSVSGEIMVYTNGAAGGTVEYVYDFTTSDGGWTTQSVTVGTPGSYSAGTGWVHGDFQSPLNNHYRGVYIGKTFSAFDVTGIDILYDLSGLATNQPTSNDCVEIIVDGVVKANITFASQTNGTDKTFSWSGSATGATSIRLICVSSYYLPGATYAGSVTIKRVTVTSQSTTARVSHSADHGATFDSPTTVGTYPDNPGGFDVIYIGSASIAAANAQTYKATTLGGAYTTLGADGATTGADPSFVLIPWYDWGSTTTKNINTTTPDYMLGSTALVSSHCLWRAEGGGGRTGITPTGATAAPGPNCVTTWKGTKAAALLSKSGTRTLFYSTTIGSTDTWTDAGSVNSAADYIRVRRKTGTGAQLFWNNGSAVAYRPTFGGTTASKTTPDTGTILGVEPFG